FREKAFSLARVVENFIQSIGAFFAAENREKDAAAKNRIDKSGGIACKQPAVTVQICAAIGKIRFDIDFRDAPRVCHSFGDRWLFGQRLLKKILGAELRLAKSFTVQNHSNTGPLGRKWNQPEPAIDGTDQNCQCPVDSFRAPDTVV